MLKAQEEYGNEAFEVGIGAEAIRELLLKLDLNAEKDTTEIINKGQ